MIFKGISMRLDDYFKRIQYQGSRECTIENLINIHRQHALHIPFDMLDPHLGIKPNLDPNYIFDKLVKGKRGGGCSQINELIALMLIEMGYQVNRLMARVLYELPKDKTPPLAHKVLLIKIGDEYWLCDTGFGGNGLIEPIPFVIDTVFSQYNTDFKIITDEKYGYRLLTKFKDNWVDLYAFNLTAYEPEDFKAMHFYNSTNPEMVFVKSAIVTMPFEEGRKILANRTYKKRTLKNTETIEIKTPEEYHRLLKQEFGIELPEHSSFFPS